LIELIAIVLALPATPSLAHPLQQVQHAQCAVAHEERQMVTGTESSAPRVTSHSSAPKARESRREEASHGSEPSSRLRVGSTRGEGSGKRAPSVGTFRGAEKAEGARKPPHGVRPSRPVVRRHPSPSRPDLLGALISFSLATLGGLGMWASSRSLRGTSGG
jgi:hypothetical protein